MQVKNPMNNYNRYLSLFFLWIGIIAIVYFTAHFSKRFLPEPSSEHGLWMDELFNYTLLIIVFVFLLTQILLFTFLFRYGNSESAVHYPYNNKIEVAWTVIPTLTFVVLFFFSSYYWDKIMYSKQETFLEIDIMAQQFNWQIRYPGKDGKLGRSNAALISNSNPMGIDVTDPASKDDFTAYQMHLPKGKQIKLKIRSKDVIHSVYLPHFRVKMDAVPGMTTKFDFIPRFTTLEMKEKLGDPDFNYEMACAELCGRGHFLMLHYVVVDELSEFNKWYNQSSDYIITDLY